ncbi:MAG: DUF4214 domain-containing protein [Actinomycetota bacterium]|nr:DUF4214 domain-containing protein [Actinomycetota bacterium]
MTLKISSKYVNSKFVKAVALLPAFALLLAALQLTGTPALAESDLTAYNHQVIRLYRTALGRSPDAEGLNYWTNRLAAGESVQDVAVMFLGTAEAASSSTGDPIIDAYHRALERAPDQGGNEFWIQQRLPMAVVAISDSLEHIRITGTVAPPIPPAPAAALAAVPPGWVDAGHGVHVPPVLLRIRKCESNDYYQAANRFSSARGAYQFLKSSWRFYGHSYRYGVAEAHLATNAQQDEAALLTWQRSGTSPWNASAGCWR